MCVGNIFAVVPGESKGKTRCGFPEILYLRYVMSYRIYPLEVILSLATDTLFANHRSVRRLCEYIVGQSIPNELYASVFRLYCRPEMLRQFPYFSDIEITKIDFRDTKPFLVSLRVTHGNTLKVTSLQPVPKISFF